MGRIQDRRGLSVVYKNFEPPETDSAPSHLQKKKQFKILKPPTPVYTSGISCDAYLTGLT